MRIQRVAYALIIVALVVTLLVVGKNFLVPIILSIVFWYLINAINSVIRYPKWIKSNVHNRITLTGSAIIFLLIMFVMGGLIAQNINAMIASAPDYRVNLEHQLVRIFTAFGYPDAIPVKSITSEFNLGNYLQTLLNSFSTITQRFLLILLYVLFLLIEQNTFPRKIAELRLSKERKENLSQIFTRVNIAVRTYLGVKTLASLATGALSYIVIKLTGLDFALFWAFLIFVLNFIPTIGSIVATLFPATVALVQYEPLSPFFTILIGVGIIQVIIGGILEPRLYGHSLNISPFIIVISLILWGFLWGIVGMLLCVPITVILIIIFAQFPSTRPIAILLSRNGRLG